LENYPGAPLEYSASDYHHVARPAPKPASKHPSALQSRNHNRRRSQFSIVSEESGKRDSYYKDPVTAASTTTKESYDPYRSSRTPLVNTKANHATVVVRQGSGASRARKASHAASLRHAAANRLQPPVQVDNAVLAQDSGQAPQHKGHSSGSGCSRSSLASSRRSEAGMRKSVSYKRQVSFQHARQRSSGNAARTRDPVRLVASDTESSKGHNTKQGFPESQSTPSLPTPPRIHRPRKPASDIDIKKARAVSHYWKDEARKVSSELGKICEEAFNRSSVSSSNVSQAKNGESPATSVSTHGENLVVPLSNHLKNRPLPQPPAESLGSYTLRELAETRRRLLEHCQGADSDFVPAYLTDVIAHLDRLMQPALRSDIVDKRSASDPNPASTRNSSHLAAIHEETHMADSSQEAYSNRSASDPVRTLQQISFQDPSRTIRLVSPEALSNPQLPPIQPLNIRKKSLTPINSLRAASTESLRSTMDRSGYDPRIYGGLDTIEEDPKSPKNKDPLGSPGGGRKRSWFKRKSDPIDETPLAPPLKNSPLKAEKVSGLQSNESLASSNGSKVRMKSADVISEAVETGPAVETKKKWFAKVFGKTSKNTVPAIAEHMIVQDMASETDSNATSTENLLAEPAGRRLKKEKASKGTQYGSNGCGPATAATGSSTDNRPVHINQNWFAKFFHIKPASRVICLCVSKAKARREIVKVLREWRKYGLRDVVSERSDGADLIKGRVDSMNCKAS
jgi:serine/threonine-protein kinase HSL1, negative regulator of Swe1 kinase